MVELGLGVKREYLSLFTGRVPSRLVMSNLLAKIAHCQTLFADLLGQKPTVRRLDVDAATTCQELRLYSVLRVGRSEFRLSEPPPCGPLYSDAACSPGPDSFPLLDGAVIECAELNGEPPRDRPLPWCTARCPPLPA